MGSLKENLGARIQQLRKSQGLTQEKLAEKIGLDTPNLSNIERGKRFVSAETLEKIAIALSVSEKELFDFGHMKNREELISGINSILESATDNQLEYFYRIMAIYTETKITLFIV